MHNVPRVQRLVGVLIIDLPENLHDVLEFTSRRETATAIPIGPVPAPGAPAAASVPAEGSPATPSEPEVETVPVPLPGVTREQLLEAGKRFQQKCGTPRVVEFLQKYSVKRLSEIPEEKRAQAVLEMNDADAEDKDAARNA